jgi:glycosyltransferase involved in cell wall biosynthesis
MDDLKLAKVAFLIRGLPKYRFPLYKILYERGNIDFQVISEKFNLPAAKLGFSQVDNTSNVPINTVDSPTWSVTLSKILNFPIPSVRAISALIKYKPDIVIIEGLSNLGTVLLATPYLLMKKVPFIWWSLGAIPNRHKTLRSKFGDIIQKYYLINSTASLAYSSHGKKYFESLDIESNKIFIVFNTLDEIMHTKNIKRCLPEVNNIKHLLNIEQQPVVVFCGTINKGKKVDLLIKSFNLFRSDCLAKDPRLIVIGDGIELDSCKNLAANMGLNNCIHFVGRQEEMSSAYLMVGDVAVLPGLGGLAINHAFIHSLPVISGPADGCEKDLIENGKTGVLMEIVDEATLFNAMKHIFSEPDKIVEMGENANKLITNTVTINNFAATIENAIIYSLKKST